MLLRYVLLNFYGLTTQRLRVEHWVYSIFFCDNTSAINIAKTQFNIKEQNTLTFDITF